MSIDSINPINFQGKLIILNDLSNKPFSNIQKVKTNLQKQIQSKDYDLYIEQNYINNKINIGVSKLRPRYIEGTIAHEELPVTAKSSRYIYAVKSAIDKYETEIKNREEKEWEQQKKQNKKVETLNKIETFLLAPIFIFGIILHDISPKAGKKLEKLLEKILYKLEA